VLLSSIATSSCYKMRAKWTFALLEPMATRVEEAEQNVETLTEQVRALETTVFYLAQERSGDTNHRSTHTTGMSAMPRAPIPLSPRRTKALQAEMTTPVKWTDKYIYAVTSGCIGGLSVLLGSCTAKAMLPIFQGKTENFADPFTWVFLVGMVVALITQTDLQNQALMMGDAMSVFPVYESAWITFGVGSGIMFYNNGTWAEDFREGAGVLFMIAGIGFLVQHAEKQKAHRLRESMQFEVGEQPTPTSTSSSAGLQSAISQYARLPSSQNSTLEENLISDEGLNRPRVAST